MYTQKSDGTIEFDVQGVVGVIPPRTRVSLRVETAGRNRVELVCDGEIILAKTLTPYLAPFTIDEDE